MDQQHVKFSKLLSFVLRHHPEAIGLKLDERGWAEIDELIACARQHGHQLDRATIEAVVVSNDKQRFKLDETGQRIRANQGHSITVDLELRPQAPPPRLFHGTTTRFLDSILSEELHPRGRQFVHLSPDHETAVAVGRRHGRPVVLVVDAEAMAGAGHAFFLTENGVWLIAEVPARHLSRLEPGA